MAGAPYIIKGVLSRPHMTRFVLFACVLAFACKRDDSAGKTAAKPVASACAKAEVKGPLTWIEDDYPAALACAREKKLPLVLDLWAPWCHTCLSMQTTVFTDPAFAADASKFVFAAIDTDREGNAEAVGKFAPSAWPTFYVIGNDEAVLARIDELVIPPAWRKVWICPRPDGHIQTICFARSSDSGEPSAMRSQTLVVRVPQNPACTHRPWSSMSEADSPSTTSARSHIGRRSARSREPHGDFSCDPSQNGLSFERPHRQSSYDLPRSS